jgi:hypothetical protein
VHSQVSHPDCVRVRITQRNPKRRTVFDGEAFFLREFLFVAFDDFFIHKSKLKVYQKVRILDNNKLRVCPESVSNWANMPRKRVFQNYLTDKISAFLHKIGIETMPEKLTEETFLTGISVKNGKLLVNEENLAFPGDWLHEAGPLKGFCDLRLSFGNVNRKILIERIG